MNLSILVINNTQEICTHQHILFQCTAPFFLSFFLQSWWVWSDSEIKEHRLTCFHDNSTNTFLCAASDENGTVFVCACLHVRTFCLVYLLVMLWGFFFCIFARHTSLKLVSLSYVGECLTVVLLISSPRLAALCPGPHGPLCRFLLHLLPGVPDSAARYGQRKSLLLPRPLSGLCRCLKYSSTSTHKTITLLYLKLLLFVNKGQPDFYLLAHFYLFL